MVDPVIETAPLQRVVHLAGAVAGDHNDRWHVGANGAELGHRDGEVGKHLEQERLELVVGTVNLVDEQNARVGLDRLQQRPRDQKPPAVELTFERFRVIGAMGRLRRAQMQQLPREVPVVERLRGVDPLVALQPDQRRLQHAGERLRQRGLADACIAFQEERPSHGHGEVRRSGHAVIGEVALLPQLLAELVRRRHIHNAIVLPLSSRVRNRAWRTTARTCRRSLRRRRRPCG